MQGENQLNIYDEALEMHKKNRGKIDVISKVKTENDHPALRNHAV